MSYRIELVQIDSITHDTFRLKLKKPSGFTWRPGQATEVALDREGWREKKRPFTFVNDPKGEQIEFVIKSYPDHDDGMTKHIPGLRPGEHLLIDEPWGAIEDKGPGTFIAGGTGITPMLGLLRARMRGEGVGQPGPEACVLIFANKTRSDIILHDELVGMGLLHTVFPLSDEQRSGFPHGHVDGPLLEEHVRDWSKPFYVCGPPPMEEAVVKLLQERGVRDDTIVTEE
ncbi:MAG: FAD-binding oxidoreductase [Myxococcota bacterium]